jgi:dTDP-4-amino-4,6-dideoxygalactose transaminase
MNLIPYGKQFIDSDDVLAVSKSLRSKIITTGKTVEKFESALKKYLNVKYVTVCNSGTSALYLALLSIGLNKNDIVIMPSVTFVASYNIAKLLGLKVFLTDVDESTGQMRPKDIIDCCKKFNIKRVGAIILMYNGGYPENAENFKKIKKKLGCFIIEDACHALGAKYNLKNKNFRIGSCKNSDIATFSLHPLKTITTGEGGVVTTNSISIDQRIKKFRSLGILKNPKVHWKYDVLHFGLNFRLNDFQCALGISQLKKIKTFLKERKKIALRYDKELKKIKNISIPSYTRKNSPSYHLYLINLKNFNHKKKDLFIKFMKKRNVILQYHYIPIYKFKIFNDKYIGKKAEKYFNETISLPIFYGLKKNEQDYIINLIKIYFKVKNNINNKQ